MKNKLLLLLLALTPLCALAEEGEGDHATTLQTALDRPESGEPVHLVVGNTTKVSGSFFTTFFGNNTSDIDVRTMLHGYSPVVWDNQLEFVPDPMVVESLTREAGAQGMTYTVRLNRDLTYCDGETPITARDYVFAWALVASPEFAALGAETPDMNVLGFDAYHAGETDVYSGIRLLGEYEFSITVRQEFNPYFYDLSQIALSPYPISVLAPGCTVADDGEGVYITNEDAGAEAPVFTAELLRKTILDPETGYLSHPQLTSGPYRLTGYDREAGVVDFELNPFYKGNYEGVKPVIDTITLVPVLPEDMVERLASGEVNLLNKCVDQSVIKAGIQLTAGGDFTQLDYPRLGYGFCAFSCEQGPQQFQAVRQALNYAFDSERFINEILGGYGMPVYGYYGVGQWMVRVCNGSLRLSDVAPGKSAQSGQYSLDSLNPYPVNLDEALRLLVEDGWTLNGDGEPFDPEKDELRYKLVDGELMPLSLHFAQCADNDAAALVVELFGETLPKLGAKLDVEVVPFTELLADYYRENGERKFDMNFMATNFVSTFDPYIVFLPRDDMQGPVNTSGIADDELLKLAWEMRITEPGDLDTFLKRWIRMQERFNEVLPTMPIYSNIYYDFHTSRLQNYHADAEYSWPVAILYAYYGEAANGQ